MAAVTWLLSHQKVAFLPSQQRALHNIVQSREMEALLQHCGWQMSLFDYYGRFDSIPKFLFYLRWQLNQMVDILLSNITTQLSKGFSLFFMHCVKGEATFCHKEKKWFKIFDCHETWTFYSQSYYLSLLLFFIQLLFTKLWQLLRLIQSIFEKLNILTWPPLLNEMAYIFALQKP